MDILFLGIILFLFVLAVFDLSVGVSNDAVNFLNSAIGSKAASFKKIIIVASIGVFVGAIMSNGMMDIARHGIFRPEHFSFYELMCIFMAVMVTDIILLDIFNSLGMPTSTTVSMVFELLGATFAISLIKMASDDTGLMFSDLLNTEKALSVIIGIFLSVAIAFFFGTVVQFLTRAIFSFNYKKNLKWKIGLFGGLAVTAILYFMLIKGVKDMAFMTADVKLWIKENTLMILCGSFVVFTILMQFLHWLKVNVLKIVVLIGTFSLAMAFAGNDLVNFIGVPLSGLSSYQDYVANGSGDPDTFMMGSLNGPANTPFYFLLAAGLIMVVSLATSKKARNVTKTEIGLGSQSGGDEMFGSSRISRRLVRSALSIYSFFEKIIPANVRVWLGRRFNTSETIVEQGASFDLIRGAVNLMLAGMLIAFGTSLKLPLSTTFVTFMVAMGTSLADRAWGRESAVFRITGVISVIGGWFITAGAAFIGAAIIVSLMFWGGNIVMISVAALAIVLLIRSNMRFKEKKTEEDNESLFNTILGTEDKAQAWSLMKIYLKEQQTTYLDYVSAVYGDVINAFSQEDIKTLSRADRSLVREKAVLKTARRKETLCLRCITPELAMEKSAWFHIANNSCMSMTYNLRRITEMCKEHVENNFRPLPTEFADSFAPISDRILTVMEDTKVSIDANNEDTVHRLRKECDKIKDIISDECEKVFERIHSDNADKLTVTYVYLNMLQESRELVSSLRKLIRASSKLQTA